MVKDGLRVGPFLVPCRNHDLVLDLDDLYHANLSHSSSVLAVYTLGYEFSLKKILKRC